MFLCKVSQWSVWHFLWSTVEVLLWTVNQLNCLWFISPLQGHFWVIIREEWQSVYYLQHKRGSLPSSFKRLNHFLWFWGVLIHRDIWICLFCCLSFFYLFNECVYLWCMGVCTLGLCVHMPHACTYREAKRTSHVLYDFLLHSLEMGVSLNLDLAIFPSRLADQKAPTICLPFPFLKLPSHPLPRWIKSKAKQGYSRDLLWVLGLWTRCLHRMYCHPCNHLPSPKCTYF